MNGYRTPTKNELAAALLGLVVGAGGAGMATPDINTLDKAVREQEAAKEKDGRYKHVKSEDYTVTEYVTPDGADGFQVITQDGYAVYSIGFGPEAEGRTYIQVKPQLAASTTP